MSLDLDLADFVVERGVDEKVDYVEARLHLTVKNEAILKNGFPELSAVIKAYGIGIRVIVKGALAFGSTNNLERREVKELLKRLIKQATNSRPLFKKPVSFSREKVEVAKWCVEEKRPIEEATGEWLMDKLKELDKAIIEKGRNVKDRFLTMNSSLEEKYFVTSEGAKILSRVPRLEFYGVITAYSNGKISQRSVQYGGAGGIESYERIGIYEKTCKEAEVTSKIVEKAKPSPQGSMDLIVGPEVAGIMAHESVGHPQEADRILGREAAQAGESYLNPNDLGVKIGSDQTFVSDDPTIPYSFGFYLFDDEGVKAGRRRLIYGGKISEFLHNRQTASFFNVKSNAAARASEFDKEPIIRMANTYVEPGDYGVEELFKDVKEGVYVKSFMEWNIDDKRLNQRYVGHEAYLVKNGEVKEMILNPVIEITTPKLWSSLDARADDLDFVAATCGKGDPMQGVPVWMGGPHLRFRNVKIGRR